MRPSCPAPWSRSFRAPRLHDQRRATGSASRGISEADAIAALHDFDALWAQLFPTEQARIIQLVVRRVTVTAAGLEVDIRREGISSVIREMVAPHNLEAAE